jgi:3-hydroxyacyl-CoA dehydrogenase
MALITIDHPPVNALSKDVRAGLIAALEEALADPGVRAIVLASVGASFCAGADIREFEGAPQPPHLTDVIQRFEDSPKPVVAALHGSVLGGGCELAAGCHYRVAAGDTRVGLPEVNLGLLPGAGGTQRLPRLIGFDAALAMMLDGKPRRIGDAVLQGYADRIVDGDARAMALAFAREIAEMGAVPRRTGSLPPPEWTPDIFERHSKAARKRRGEPAAEKIVAAVRRATDMPFADAVVYARADFLALRDTVEASALRYAFFAERQAAKPGPEIALGTARPLSRGRESGSPRTTRKRSRRGALRQPWHRHGLRSCRWSTVSTPPAMPTS